MGAEAHLPTSRLKSWLGPRRRSPQPDLAAQQPDPLHRRTDEPLDGDPAPSVQFLGAPG